MDKGATLLLAGTEALAPIPYFTKKTAAPLVSSALVTTTTVKPFFAALSVPTPLNAVLLPSAQLSLKLTL